MAKILFQDRTRRKLYPSVGGWHAPLLIESLRNCHLISVNNTSQQGLERFLEVRQRNDGGISKLSYTKKAVSLPLPSSVLVANNGDCVDGVVVLSYVGCDRGDVNRD
uniref:Uncharacterized protein n=1 Tax=Glossina austeni TaxID=7395 RepID=A0A1A9UND7_GLOAU